MARQRSSSASNESNNRKRKATTSSSSTIIKKKLRYPKKSLDLSTDTAIQPGTQEKAKSTLQTVVDDICKFERNALDELVNENSADSSNKDMKKLNKVVLHLNEFLDDFLEELKSEEGSDNISFHPEISIEERRNIMNLKKERDALLNYSRSLSILQSNHDLVAKQFDLWLHSNPKQTNPAQTVVSDYVQQTFQQYLSILQEMDTSCDLVLASLDDTQKESFEARQVQEKLYDAFNKKRLQMENKGKVNKDTKELIKSMPKLFK